MKLVDLSALGIATALAAGCAGLFKPPPPPSAQGPNPLVSNAPLTVTHRPTNFPAYTCKPGRVEDTYVLSVDGDQLCVAATMGAMKPVGEGPPTFRPFMFAFRVDGTTSSPFELKVERPAIGAECRSSQAGSSPYVDWAVDGKGCTPLAGVLTASAKVLDLVDAETGTVYATYQFASAAGATP